MTNTKLVLVFGRGENEVVWPITCFASSEEAYEKLSDIFGRPPDKTSKDSVAWNVNEDSTELFAKLFINYYDGCGGIWQIVAKEITSGQLPIFTFSLD